MLIPLSSTPSPNRKRTRERPCLPIATSWNTCSRRVRPPSTNNKTGRNTRMCTRPWVQAYTRAQTPLSPKRAARSISKSCRRKRRNRGRHFQIGMGNCINLWMVGLAPWRMLLKMSGKMQCCSKKRSSHRNSMKKYKLLCRMRFWTQYNKNLYSPRAHIGRTCRMNSQRILPLKITNRLTIKLFRGRLSPKRNNRWRRKFMKWFR